MSVTWNSSKQRSQASSASAAAVEADRIVVGDLARFDLLAIRVHALVHLGHELVKMRAAFPLHGACGKEQVHQHGLAAPDVAVDVETLDRLCGILFREQPAEMRGFARQPVLRQPLLEPREPRGNRFLRRVALDLALRDERAILFGNR